MEYHKTNSAKNAETTTYIGSIFKENGTEIKKRIAEKTDTYIKISHFEKPFFCK